MCGSLVMFQQKEEQNLQIYQQYGINSFRGFHSPLLGNFEYENYLINIVNCKVKLIFGGQSFLVNQSIPTSFLKCQSMTKSVQ